jgi:hypothetical protein
MASPTPEQLLALNAMLQQNLQQDLAALKLAFPVTIQNASIGVDPNTLSRMLVLEGTALAQGLDQILVKTAAGDVVLKAQQTMEQQLLNLLPSRVTVQMRPGPDGLQAVLVVGNRAAIPEKPLESVTGSSMASPNQTLAAEIPKLNAIHQALILPSSLFSSQTPEQFLQSLIAHAQAKEKPGNKPGTPQQNTLSTVFEKLGFNAQSETAKAAMDLYAPPKSSSGGAAAPAAGLAYMPQATALKILGTLTPEEAMKMRTPNFVMEDGAEIAVVRGNTPSGNPVLSVGDKLIAIQGGKNWPVGMELKVSMGAQAGFVVMEELDGLDMHSWGALRAALEALASQSPALVADMARVRLPQPQAQQLPGALLFFMAAMQRGIPGWLGEEFVEQLKKMGKEDLVRKVQEQWREQMGRECDGPGGQWRGISVPLFDQARMQHMRLYIYDPPDQRKKKKDDPSWARRFLIDMDLSRIGAVQLDGLVHKRRLELVVRTQRALDPDLRKDLMDRFMRTLEEVRYGGDLRFAANKTGWVEIKDKASPPTFLKEM